MVCGNRRINQRGGRAGNLRGVIREISSWFQAKAEERQKRKKSGRAPARASVPAARYRGVMTWRR
jgi:hypothetical protein